MSVHWLIGHQYSHFSLICCFLVSRTSFISLALAILSLFHCSDLLVHCLATSSLMSASSSLSIFSSSFACSARYSRYRFISSRSWFWNKVCEQLIIRVIPHGRATFYFQFCSLHLLIWEHADDKMFYITAVMLKVKVMVKAGGLKLGR